MNGGGRRWRVDRDARHGRLPTQGVEDPLLPHLGQEAGGKADTHHVLSENRSPALSATHQDQK